MSVFKISTEYLPAGDQPKEIEKLVEGGKKGFQERLFGEVFISLKIIG
jgi:excinuclease UvrABC helicase subunit UvrB